MIQAGVRVLEIRAKHIARGVDAEDPVRIDVAPVAFRRAVRHEGD